MFCVSGAGVYFSLALGESYFRADNLLEVRPEM